jgi:channel protein (hemolysin III family)
METAGLRSRAAASPVASSRHVDGSRSRDDGAAVPSAAVFAALSRSSARVTDDKKRPGSPISYSSIWSDPVCCPVRSMPLDMDLVHYVSGMASMRAVQQNGTCAPFCHCHRGLASRRRKVRAIDEADEGASDLNGVSSEKIDILAGQNGRSSDGSVSSNDDEAEPIEDSANRDYDLREVRHRLLYSAISPMAWAPMMMRDLQDSGGNQSETISGKILADYIAACRFYGAVGSSNGSSSSRGMYRSSASNSTGIIGNVGVLTTFRFALPSLKVSSGFRDVDMLALVEVLLLHGNGPLRYIKRLDFSVPHREAPSRSGIRSHGALALAKFLQHTQFVSDVRLSRNLIGPFGATAIFIACAYNPVIQSLDVRRCQIRERGALVFAELIPPSAHTGLRRANLSANGIGQRGLIAIERALIERDQKSVPSKRGERENVQNNETRRKHVNGTNDTEKQSADAHANEAERQTQRDSLEPPSFLAVDVEGNLVFQEIVNGATHGFGIPLALIGTYLLMNRARDKGTHYIVSCGVYSFSLLVLYTSSTLYHSFVTLRTTKYLFEVFDKCAIYILIAGSYTPFLQILLHHVPKYSVYLLLFIWSCCVLGVVVEAAHPTWHLKAYFSLAMYIGMGWSAVACLSDVAEILPMRATVS